MGVSPLASAIQQLLTVPQRSSATAVILTLLARLLGPCIAKGPQSQATTPITVTTQPPGRPSGDCLDLGLPTHQGDTRQAEDTGSGEQNPDGAQAAVVRRNTAPPSEMT